MNSLIYRIADPIAAAVLGLASPALIASCRARSRAPLSRKLLDKIGVGLVRHHYYEPLIKECDLRFSLDVDRDLPGLDFSIDEQLSTVRRFSYRDELLSINSQAGSKDASSFANSTFGPGDSEIFYNIIRELKPSKIVEIGAGQSTLLARLAISQNREEDAGYDPEHLCIEPYEQPWLERVGVRVVRERVENCSMEIFTSLGKNDILFIDSSHVIRPQGDVLFEYLEILPRLKAGVLVHIHDIFTPRDYPRQWVLDDRRLWNEQYLLEAFLSYNSEYKIFLAVNWLHHHHRQDLQDACPVLLANPKCEPGSFWIQRRQASSNSGLEE